MKTIIGLMAFLTFVTGAFAAPVVTIHATASKSGGLPESGVRSGQNVSLVTPEEAQAITAPTFGVEAVVKDGETPINTGWTLNSLTYTLRVNGNIALDAAGNPILNRQLGAFNAVGGAGPDIRGLNTSFAQSVPYGTQTSGVTLTGTNSIILSAHVVSLGGDNRPLLAHPGDRYSIEYAMTGTVNGTPFNVKATAIVVVGLQVVWLDLQSPSVWKDGSSLVRDQVVTEVGNTTDFVRGVRIAATGVGKQYVLVGWQATTDLIAQPWVPWNTTIQSGTFAPDGSGVVDLKAVGGLVGPQRIFRLRHISVEAPSAG